MEKVKQFFDMSFKKAWIISAVIYLLDVLFLALYSSLTINVYYISNFIVGAVIVAFSLLLLKKLEIKKGWLVALSILSIIVSIFFPMASLLPIITLTAVTSEKKSNIPMWILGIILVILAIISLPLGILMMVFASDSMPTGFGAFIYYAIFYYILHKPLITLYTVLLGNKKSYWYYLILLPEIAVILFFIGYDIFMYFATKVAA